MPEFACFFTLEVSHPLIAPSSWTILPDAACETYLWKNRLRLRKMGEKAVFWGEETTPLQQRHTGETLSFFLFCSDPYFQRAPKFPISSRGGNFWNCSWTVKPAP